MWVKNNNVNFELNILFYLCGFFLQPSDQLIVQKYLVSICSFTQKFDLWDQMP